MPRNVLSLIWKYFLDACLGATGYDYLILVVLSTVGDLVMIVIETEI